MICIKTYANLFETEFALRTLGEHGLEAHLSSEESGGPVPSSFATGGVRLFVDDGDVDRVIAILTSPSDDTAVGIPEIRPTPSKRLRSGMLWLVGGLIVTAGSYMLAAPGGTFLVTSGAIFYGLYQIARGVRDAWVAVHEREEAESRKQDVSN